MKKINIFIYSLILAVSFTSCDNFLDIEPEGKVIPKTQEQFRALLTRGYEAYPTHKSLIALRTDEVRLESDNYDFMSLRDIYTWKDQGQDKQTLSFPWEAFYNTIFYTNHVLIDGATLLPDTNEKKQLLGEAFALRAYAYFDLVNLYGKPYQATTANATLAVPLALEINLENVLKPESIATVYEQIHKDLEQAKSLLQVNTQESGSNYRFSKAAVYAFEARVNLYQNNWQDALNSATKALTYQSALEDLNTATTVPSHYKSVESILALENTLTSSIQNSTSLSPELLAAYNPAEDLRFSLYFEPKGADYKVIKVGNIENKTSLRTSELYFIIAEAQAQQNQISEAVATLTPFFSKRYTAEKARNLENELATYSKESFISFLLEERYREFAFEGHRWFDLRRLHQKEIQHQLHDQQYILQQNDPRYTLPYPTDAKLNNPNL